MEPDGLGGRPQYAQMTSAALGRAGRRCRRCLAPLAPYFLARILKSNLIFQAIMRIKHIN